MYTLYRDLVVMELKDPLLAVNCAKMLMTLPTIAHDFDLGWKLLTKGLQMAPNDLIVLKAVARVIFLSKRNVTIYIKLYFLCFFLCIYYCFMFFVFRLRTLL